MAVAHTKENSAVFVDQYELGPMENYMYSIGNKVSRELVIIDPAWDADAIRARAEEHGCKIIAILLTHGHADHTNAVNAILDTHDIPVYISRHEAEMYKPMCNNLIEVEPGFEYELGGAKIKFIHTPGHTPGSQCLLVDGHLIAGDTLFIDGCGRCDLPAGDAEAMYHSITETLMKLPDSTLIYAGHNYHHKLSDTLANQKQTNPYMRCENLNQFLYYRGY